MTQLLEPIRINLSQNQIIDSKLNQDSTQNHQDLCAICCESLNDPSQIYTIPNCGHKFHSNCLIPWFRTGSDTCPYCRGTPDRHTSWRTRYNVGIARYKFVRNYSRRKNAPKQLKTLLTRLRKFETKIKTEKKFYKDWKISEEGQQFKKLDKKQKYMRRKKWDRKSKLKQLKTALACYPIVPAIVQIDN